MSRELRSDRRASCWRRLAALLAAAVLLLVAVAWIVGGRLVSAAPRSVPPPVDLPVETVALASDSGATLAAWWIDGQPDAGVVVLLHGRHGSRLQMLDRARSLHDLGYSTLLVDFQAHGESTGDRTSAGYWERFDAQAAVAYARRRRPSEPLAVVGVSMGGAASLLASPLEVDALVLESVYPTVEEAIANRVRLRLGPAAPLATGLLTWQLRPRLGVSPEQIRPIDHIAAAGCPVLILAGEVDRRTTPTETRRLFDAAHEPKELHVFPGAEHVDLHAHAPDAWRRVVSQFLENSFSAAHSSPPVAGH